MRLIANWKYVLRKAWSIRLWVFSALFETMGMVLPVFVDSVSRADFTVLSLISAAGGIWARLVEQKGVTNANTTR